MHPQPRWHPQSTMGWERTTDPQPPAFLPLDLHAEWSVITTTDHNLLLAGPRQATDAMLAVLTPYLREPLCLYTPETGVSLPEPAGGTLILLEVTRLNPEQQRQMLQWLDRMESRARIVSTTPEPIFALVRDGAFLGDLYYRLNVLRIDVDSFAAGERES